MNRRLFAILFLATLLALILTVSQAQETQPVFRIGVLDDERGPISNGARLAVKEINDAGGVQGAEGTVFRLELVIQSTHEGDTLANAISAISEARVIAVVGPETTDEVLSNLPLLQRPNLDVPVLTAAIGDTVIASDSTENLYRIRAAERLLGSSLAAYLVEELAVTRIVTVQLDRNSTAGRVGFSFALSQLGVPVDETTLLLDSSITITDLVTEVIGINPPVTVAYGAPDLVADLYTQLRASQYFGAFAYPDAEHPTFKNAVPFDELPGIIGTTTWPLAATDSMSSTFLNSFVRNIGTVPGPIEAAAYDAIYLLAQAIGMPGDLRSNLSSVRDFPGVQGILNPSGLARGEMSDTVAVIQLNALGGANVAARYAAGERLTEDQIPVIERSPTPTPTPEGVIITIQSAVQNVRTGPGLEYDVLGQMRQGEQAQVIGATADFSWVVIQYRGQNGWLATYLLDVFGDRSGIPVILPPPTPTPLPATATPTAAPLPDIVITGASPTNITQGAPTLVNVTIRNAGSVAAGPFAVAVTFPPDNVFASANLAGLAPGAEQLVQLSITLSGATGNYAVAIVADLNNEVNEGAVGEANNAVFAFNYRLDRQLILINNTTLNNGATIDLEGNITPITDLQYTGAGLNTAGTCNNTSNCIGLLSPAQNWDTSHYDAISAATGINTTFIANASLTPGTTVGVLTAEGRRAVLRVDAINPGISITITYRVYQ